MKTLFNTLFIGGAMLLSTISFAQTKEENHAQLTAHHAVVKEHANKIASGESKTKAEHKEHAAEMEKSLKAAKASHQALKKTMHEKDKAAAKIHHEAIEKHHAEAKVHHDKLKAELAKDKYNEAKTKEHAKNVYTSTDNAEKEHQKLKVKTSVK
jgi:hypothetical protein